MHSIVSDKISRLLLVFRASRSKVRAAGGSVSPAPILHTTKTTYAPNSVGKTEQGQAPQANLHESIQNRTALSSAVD